MRSFLQALASQQSGPSGGGLRFFRSLIVLLALAILSTSSSSSVSSSKLCAEPSTGALKLDQSQTDTTSIREFDLPVNDVIYNALTQQIYASIPSSGGAIGNSITAIDPVLGIPSSSVFIGSEPGRLALTTNNQYIYALISGGRLVRRYDIAAQTAGPQFSLDYLNRDGLEYAQSLTAIPGSPNSVALAKAPPGSSSGYAVRFAVYDDGVERPSVFSSIGYENASIVASADGGNLYALSGALGTLATMTISAAGLTIASEKPIGAAGRMKIDGGLIYTSFGKVIDPVTGTVKGTFTAPDNGLLFLVAPDSSINRCSFATFSGSPQDPGTVTLRVFDQTTFAHLGAITIPGVKGSPTALIRWGANGLVFATTQQLYLVQSTLISSAAPVPSPTPTPSPTPSPTPTPTVLDVKQVTLKTNDLVVDPNTQTIYASVPNSASSNQNTIAPINPVTGSIGPTVPIGNDPGRMAISDNGQFIYVALNGAAAVRRFNVAAQTAGLQFSLGTHPSFGTLSPTDLSVMPDNPETVAVARRYAVGFTGGVAIYDNGVQRGSATIDNTGNKAIAFSASPSVLYGMETDVSDYSFYKNAVASCGVSIFSRTEQSGGGPTLKVDNGLAYIGIHVVDPETGVIVGTFTLPQLNSVQQLPLVVPDSRSNRVFFLVADSSSVRLLAYDMQTFLAVGAEIISGVNGVASSLVRWGAKGFAFRTQDSVYLIQSSLVPDSPPPVIPAPTPAQPIYNLFGGVVDNQNHGISGVTITLTGAVSGTMQTGTNGTFSFADLPQCATYTVTANSNQWVFYQDSYTFSPAFAGSIHTGNIGVGSFQAIAPINGNVVDFSTVNFHADAGANFATVTVVRGGNTSAAATVDYSTYDISATQARNYIASSGTLTFAPGETTRTFRVLLIRSGYIYSPPTLVGLSLIRPSGVTLGSYSFSTLWIDQNTLPPQNVNPIDDSATLVREQYLDFLNREPDQPGLDYWTTTIAACGNDPLCIHDRRVAVADAFFFEPEFQDTGSYVYSIYKASFPGIPTYAQFSIDRPRVLGGSSLDSGKTAFATDFANRSTFVAVYPLTLSGADYVNALIAAVKTNTGVDLTSQSNALLMQYNAGSSQAQSRGLVLRSIADNQTFLNAEYNEIFVVVEYFGYLRRNPDDGGRNFWLGQVNSFPLKDIYVQHAMVCSFITSAEYQQRFSPLVTHSNAECPH
jgi:hypothetical protein